MTSMFSMRKRLLAAAVMLTLALSFWVTLAAVNDFCALTHIWVDNGLTSELADLRVDSDVGGAAVGGIMFDDIGFGAEA